MDKKELGLRIKELRTINKLTQQDIANYLQLKNKSNVGSWEIGKAAPDIDTFAKLCILFNISPNEFINFNENVTITIEEKKHLEKYRQLDSTSKEIINYLIDKELSRQSAEPVEVKNIIKLPLADFSLSAGLGTTLLDNTYEWIEIDGDKYPNADVAFRISGNSMEPKYHDSDIVYIHKQDTLEIGEIGAFLFNGEQYLKKFAYDNGMYRLRSLNPEYKDITIDNDSLIIYGKVIN